jgi:tRNA-specific 2-thiouridylase
MKKRVVVAMSGGVDSAVAAALLKKQGYEVIGITMCFSLPDTSRKKPSCCGIGAIEDARRVAHKLGIRHYVLNMQATLRKKVVANFLREYLAGRTPNPCIRCNQFLKFGILLKKARSLGAQFLATGHYARIVVHRPSSIVHRKFLLKKAKDKLKDQSYFLYRLSQNQLRHILFPLGNYTKARVRQLAQEFGLPVARKAASQEICFIPQDDYRAFLQAHLPGKIKGGLVKDNSGNILGKHRGIAFYTVGQRQGLGIALGYPAYIIRLNPRDNSLVVGNREEARAKAFLVKGAHFILGPAQKKIALEVKIRYNHQQTPAEIMPFKNLWRVSMGQSQFAVTPGQSAVFYRGDTIIGGGTIAKVVK